MTTARFEICRTDAGQPWHARFRAANGRVVWSTENYARRQRAVNAVTLVTGGGLVIIGDQLFIQMSPVVWGRCTNVEVRDVDLRDPEAKS